MSMGNIVLVVVAHADDETLGCGATLRRHHEEGDDVYCVSLTDGVGARSEALAQHVEERHAASLEAGKILGFTWAARGNFPDNALDSVPTLELTRFVESAKKQVGPNLVYTHHGSDLNVDHRITFQAVLTAFRPAPGEECSEIRSFEVSSSTEWSTPALGPAFRPNLFVDVNRTFSHKLLALRAYGAEMRAFPHTRSLEALEALAIVRGSQVGLARAEAFDIIRRIVL
jgi:LmbE family N-acetylglucosaminyl deacetylase